MTEDEVVQKLSASHAEPETDEAFERRMAQKLQEWLMDNGCVLDVQLARAVVQTPNGQSQAMYQPQIHLLKKKAAPKIILPDMSQATKQVAMELMKGGKK